MTTTVEHLSTNESTLSQNLQGFGTIKGMYIPSLLMIFGVVVFLRMGWIVGTAGIEATCVIIGLSGLIVLFTMLSMSAIVTNIQVGKGGIYYILSRLLGVEVGSAVGLLLYFKGCMSIAFCTIGFAECVHDLLPHVSITTIGLITLAVLAIPTFTSADFVLKMQMAIFGSIFLALLSFFTGDASQIEIPSMTVQPQFSFWRVFAIFFPAMTGVEASIALSGSLKNPARSLPLGSVIAVVTGSAVYLAIAIFLHCNVASELLISDPLIAQHIASFSLLILFGIWGATLSSSLGGLLGTPRTLQALAIDGIVPKFFGKEYGKAKEPRIATMITLLIAFCAIYLGSINALAPLLTMICLICYGLVNLACCFEETMANPSWRPTFPLHWSISLVGVILCLIAMLMIDSGSALITTFLALSIFFFAKKRNFSKEWDDICDGIFMFFARKAIYSLAYKEPSSKSWRPNLLVFTSKPTDLNCDVLRFSKAITHGKGFLTLASFISDPLSKEKMDELSKEMHQLLRKNRISALVEIGFAKTLTAGIKKMVHNYGLGPLTPDTVIFGAITNKEEIKNCVQVIELVQNQNRNLVLINDNLNPMGTEQKMESIDIWWDSAMRTNSELMIILAHMMQKDQDWKKAKISVKCVVSSETEQHEQAIYLEELFTRNRLNITVDAFVGGQEANETIELVRKHSFKASFVFLSLKLPQEGQSAEEYGKYLELFPLKSREFPSLALVLASPTTNLKEIFFA